jgi:hypothetical protein
MLIAIIGAGAVGSALARGWSRSGHNIRFGVRDAAAPPPIAAEIGAEVLDARSATASSDVIVLALPWSAAESVVTSLPLDGKLLMDCMNPLAMRDGALGLALGFTESGAENVAAWAPGARVVKTLNQVGAEVMADARRFAQPPAMFIAGDDPQAKETTAVLVRDLGFEPLDAGALKQARILEPLAMVWINQALMRGFGRDWAFTAQRAQG